jgi:hypothetical protein
MEVSHYQRSSERKKIPVKSTSRQYTYMCQSSVSLVGSEVSYLQYFQGLQLLKRLDAR